MAMFRKQLNIWLSPGYSFSTMCSNIIRAHDAIGSAVRQVSLLFFLLGSAAPCVAQLPTKPTEEVEIDRQEIVNLELENARAIQNHDTTFFRRVYGDDFSGIFSSGQLITKPGVLILRQSMINRYDF